MSSDWSDPTPEPVLVVSTGGTIDKVYFDARSNYEVGESVVGDLLRQAKVHLPFELLPLLRKDSLDITDEERAMIRDRIAARPERRVIVTHGTDTMVETARVLAGLPDRTIVLTGSLSPARFAQTDAVFNVGMAFAAVQTLPPGVYIVMNGQVFAGDRVAKDKEHNVFVRV
ncbi:MAG TPA: asparaginase domain-containing protein [Pseudomonadales bacterium]